MDTWTEDDVGNEFGDGTVWRYNRASHVMSLSFLDGTHASYDAGANKLVAMFKDGAVLAYDAAAHAYSIQLPNGASFSVTLNGATFSIDASGKISIISPTDIAFKTSTLDDTLDGIQGQYDGHVHTGVQSGSDNTGPPTVPIP